MNKYTHESLLSGVRLLCLPQNRMITIIISLIMRWDHITVRFAFPPLAQNMTVYTCAFALNLFLELRLNITCLQCMCVMYLGYSSAVMCVGYSGVVWHESRLVIIVVHATTLWFRVPQLEMPVGVCVCVYDDFSQHLRIATWAHLYVCVYQGGV